MGIKDLKKLIVKYSPDAYKVCKLNEYRNHTVAIDASIYMYRYMSSGDLTIKTMLTGIIRQILVLLEAGIHPIYVFDGKPPNEKTNVLKNRNTIKNNNKTKLVKLNEELENLKNENVKDLSKNENVDDLNKNNTKKIKQLEGNIYNVKKSLVSIGGKATLELQQLLTKLGVKYLIAKGEAEVLCAKLCKEEHVYACMTEDTDVFPNGAKKVWMNFDLKTKTVVEYSLDNILNGFKMDMSTFIDLCILCGCDYCSKIDGLASIGAYKQLLTQKSIENILKMNKYKNNVNGDFLNEYIQAQKLFNVSYVDLLDKDININDLFIKININDEMKMYFKEYELGKQYLKMINNL